MMDGNEALRPKRIKLVPVDDVIIDEFEHPPFCSCEGVEVRIVPGFGLEPTTVQVSRRLDGEVGLHACYPVVVA